MFNNIKDSLIEKMLNKIIDEKEINITASLNPKNQPMISQSNEVRKQDLAGMLADNEVSVKISFGKKD
ncbi:hypothetical protein [Lactococcus phage CHPC971]|nr:hypothetical protein KMD16_gp33 [Lactococcus phage CHPC971]QCW07635.1 hypothetical protein [Lactococcus phage CHPC971]QGJ84782.1 hypothetical protein [Lactococcus phage P1046]